MKNDTKLMICTQKIDRNDPALGFFHEWVREFSKNCDFVTVICLSAGEYNLPSNVRVYSLGKDTNLKKWFYIYHFFSYIFRFRKDYKYVFAHMNPEYIVLGGLVWRLLEKRISLWYTHKSVDLKLRLATLITEYIFTASRMSFRLNSKKVNVTGHGIDTSLFMPNNLNKKNGVYTIVCVGRISKTKDQLNLIKAIEIVIKSGILVKLMIIGEPITDEDLKYLDTLKNYVSDQKLSNAVIFSGPVTSANMPTYYQNADMSVNLSKTGSLDKVVLESMSCGLVSLSSNEAFLDILGPYNMMLSDANPEEISKKIIYFAKTENTSDIRNKLREFVINGHSLNKLIPKILNVLK